MCRLKDIVENASTSAGSIAGFRGALFTGVVQRPEVSDQLTMSPYATTPNPFKRKKRTMKVRDLTIKENQEFDVVTTSALKDLLRNKQRDSELQNTTDVFALEDNDGAIVKVYVKKDQSKEFKQAIETSLADAEESPKEVAEILFDLHKEFDIVSVDWGDGAIPEDEEAAVTDSIDAEAKGFPDNDELDDVEASQVGTPDQASAAGDLPPDVGADVGTPDIDGAVDQTKMFNQIISLLQAQADAQRAQADAAKAKADVEAAEAAGKAAAQYSAHQEEVMDMDNYNKSQQEKRRENQIQAKLIRYRHDLRKDDGKSLTDKLDDPEFLLNTLHKTSIGESVNITPPTPEEEEILHMEDWENDEKDKKHQEQLRQRMLKYKHARRKTEQAAAPAVAAAPQQESADEPADNGKFDPKTGTLMDYLLRSKQLAAASNSNVANQ